MLLLVILGVLAAYVVSCGLSWTCRRRFAPVLIRRVVEKRGWFWATLRFILRPLTDFYSANTAIGDIVAIPYGTTLTEDERRHEGTHIDQYASLGWGNPWVGLPMAFVLYVLLPLPVKFAWFRYRWELAAYRAQGVAPERIVKLLSGKAYGWAWPRSLIRRELGLA